MKKFENLLWLIYIVSIIVIFVFPINRPSYSWVPVQTTLFFGDDLIIFGIAYLALVISLALLSLRLSNDQNSVMKGALLVSGFIIVHTFFWVLRIPNASFPSFDAGGLSYSQFILNNGGLAFTSQIAWGYFEFPAISILGSFLSNIESLTVINVENIFLTVTSLFIPVSIYIFIQKTTQNTKLAILASVLAVMGNVQIRMLGYFRPGTLGFIFFIAFFLLLAQLGRGRFNKKQNVLILLLFSGLCLVHFMSFLAFFFMLSGLYVVPKILHAKPYVGGKIILAILLIFIGFRLYLYYGYVLNFLGARAWAFFGDVASPFTLWFFSDWSQAYLGSSTPIWATITRTFWLGVIVLGVIIVLLKTFLQSKKLSEFDLKISSCVIGLSIFLLILFLFDNGGHRTIEQFLTFMTFFSIIAISQTVWSTINPHSKKIAYGFIAIILILAAFPTFLALNPTVNTERVFPQESRTFAFLVYTWDGHQQIFADVSTSLPISYYLPIATVNYIPAPPDGAQNAEEYFNILLPRIMRGFESSSQSIFIYSDRITQSAFTHWGISPQSTVWNNITNGFNENNRVYNSNFNVIYVSQGD